MEKLCIVVLYLSISISTLFTPNEARAYSRMLRFQVYKASENSNPNQPIKKLKIQTHISIEDPYAALNSPFSLPPFGSPSPISPPSNTPHYCINEPPPQRPPSKPTVSSPPKQVPRSPQVYSPPLGHHHPPPARRVEMGVWCVAKPTVPNSIIQEAMDYACGSGADCKAIALNGVCFQPDTILAHASYAFNSYWQSTRRRYL